MISFVTAVVEQWASALGLQAKDCNWPFEFQSQQTLVVQGGSYRSTAKRSVKVSRVLGDKYITIIKGCPVPQ